MNEQEHVQRGREAKMLLDNPLWREAWEAYRTRLLHLIETADSAAVDQVMQAKRLLTAGVAARAYLEKIITDGAVSAATIQMNDARNKRRAA